MPRTYTPRARAALMARTRSKRGLLLAVIDSTQRDVGLYADFDHVWSSPDGGTALRRMVEATIRLWHGAWDLVRVRDWAPERAGAIAVHAAVASVVDQSIPPVTGPPADWSQVLQAGDVIDLATAPRVETDG